MCQRLFFFSFFFLSGALAGTPCGAINVKKDNKMEMMRGKKFVVVFILDSNTSKCKRGCTPSEIVLEWKGTSRSFEGGLEIRRLLVIYARGRSNVATVLTKKNSLLATIAAEQHCARCQLAALQRCRGQQ